MATILISPGLDEAALQYTKEQLGEGYELVRLLADGSAPPHDPAASILIWCDWTNATIVRTLETAPYLRWIHACTNGVDQLWHPIMNSSTIHVTRSPSAASIPVAEWAVAALLICGKRFDWYEEKQAERVWSPVDPVELYGATLMVVGTGAIGERIGDIVMPFGMRTIGVNTSGAELSSFDESVPVSRLREHLPSCDFVVLACPLTDDTRGLFGASEFVAMKSSSYLVNVARGAVLVEDDLVRAVRSGEIAGAFLDVFEMEPLQEDSVLWATPGIRITPHSAWRSPRSHERAINDFLEHLPRFESGGPMNPVGPA